MAVRAATLTLVHESYLSRRLTHGHGCQQPVSKQQNQARTQNVQGFSRASVGRLAIRGEPKAPAYANSTKISIAKAWKRWTQ